MSSSSATNIVPFYDYSNRTFAEEQNESNSTSTVQRNLAGLLQENVSTLPMNDYLLFLQQSQEKSDENEVKEMDSNKILEKYMDKVDADQRNLREEMREREERMIKISYESESRINERLNKIEELISNQNSSINMKFERMEDKYDSAVKDIKSNKITITGICIATIISIAGIAYAAMQVFQGFVNIVTK